MYMDMNMHGRTCTTSASVEVDELLEKGVEHALALRRDHVRVAVLVLDARHRVDELVLYARYFRRYLWTGGRAPNWYTCIYIYIYIYR